MRYLMILVLMLATLIGPPAAGAAPTLNGHLAAVCPSQPGAMTKARCIQWVQVAQCETGGQQIGVTLPSIRQINWRYNGKSGYDGALQFSSTTWTSNIHRVPARKLTRHQRLQRARGVYHHAWAAPAAVQILTAETLRMRPDSTGLGNWPTCGAWF